jgi:DNA-binding transcriptional LysR family regulator
VVLAARRPLNEPRGAVAESTWEGLRPFEDALAARGLKQRIGVTVPDIYSAIAVVARSNMAALIPRRLGVVSQKAGLLHLIEPPHATVEIRMSLMGLRERLHEPAMAWMKGLLMEVGSQA